MKFCFYSHSCRLGLGALSQDFTLRSRLLRDPFFVNSFLCFFFLIQLIESIQNHPHDSLLLCKLFLFWEL
jgi:hypothetical protein